MLTIIVIFLIILGLVASIAMPLLIFPVIRDTVNRSGKMGLNVSPTVCPRCGNTESPTVRRPANKRQALWGGMTCSKCGCERDKWGNEIPSS